MGVREVSRAAGLFLEALRLDLETVDAVRGRAERAVALGVGGFLIFGGEAEAVAELVTGVRAAAARPLWVAADLERGAGQQFRGLAQLPPPAALATHPEAEVAVRRAARRTALGARRVGVNWALAPVLDLDAEPRNPIVGTRAFGADPEAVAWLGRTWIEACQAEGVAACAKHFPGHGRTTSDSHAELPSVEATREALEADLRPFREVAGVVASVMTAHVAFPSLGARGPATLEPAVLTDLLRGEIGFEGLVVSDALVMAGVRRGRGAGSRGAGAEGAGAGEADEEAWGALAAAALRAGCDLLLYPPELERAVAGLEAEAERDPRLTERIEAALARSARVLERFPPAAAESSARPAGGGRPRGTRGAPMEDAEAEAEALALAAECLAVEGAAAPSQLPALDPEAPLAVVPVWDDRRAPGRAPFGEILAAELRALGWRDVRVTGAPRGSEPAVRGKTAAADGSDSARVVLVAATPQAWKGTAGLTPRGHQAAAEALAAPGPAVPVVFGHPRVAAALGRPALVAWATEEMMERAAARWLDRRARAREGGVGEERGRWEA